MGGLDEFPVELKPGRPVHLAAVVQVAGAADDGADSVPIDLRRRHLADHPITPTLVPNHRREYFEIIGSPADLHGLTEQTLERGEIQGAGRVERGQFTADFSQSLLLLFVLVGHRLENNNPML